MTYQSIEKVNATLKTMDVKGKGYVEVNERVKAFRMLYPEGLIKTTLISDDGERCVISAEVWDAYNGKLLATGTAYEVQSSSYINKTSYVENCETSAVGRALGFLGIGIDTSIASANEVDMAIKKQAMDSAISESKKSNKKPIPQVVLEYNEEQEAHQKELIAKLKEYKATFVQDALNLNADKGWYTEDDLPIEYLEKCLKVIEKKRG